MDESSENPMRIYWALTSREFSAALLDRCFPAAKYELSFYESRDALYASVAECRPDILFLALDFDKPGAALEILKDLRESLLPSRTQTVVLGEEGDAQKIGACIEAGANDFLIGQLDAPLLEARLKALLRTRQMQTIVEQQSQQIQVNHDHMLHEQQVAKEVFDKIAHDGSLAMPNIQRWLSPIAVFNGDVFLAAPTPGGGLLAILGDFTGHGLSAAIGAMPLASTFYGMADKGFSMTDIIKELNAKLKDTLPVSVFCCATMVHIDFVKRSLDVWNGGLPDCYIVRAGTSSIDSVGDSAAATIENLRSNALPLGILSSREFKVELQSYTLNIGDRVYLLSDGLLEASDEQGQQFGDARIVETLAAGDDDNHQQRFDTIKQQVSAFISDESRADDISLIEIRMVEASDFADMHEQAGRSGVQEPVSWSCSYLARPDSLRHQDPVPLLLHTLMEVPALRQFSSQLYTIFTELYTNALDHGLLGLASSLKHQPEGFAEYYAKRVERLQSLNEGSVRFTLDYKGDANSGVLMVDVEDTGQGFDYASQRDTLECAQTLHGRGIALLNSICHKVEYLGCGNHARVEFRWAI